MKVYLLSKPIDTLFMLKIKIHQSFFYPQTILPFLKCQDRNQSSFCVLINFYFASFLQLNFTSFSSVVLDLLNRTKF